MAKRKTNVAMEQQESENTKVEAVQPESIQEMTAEPETTKAEPVLPEPVPVDIVQAGAVQAKIKVSAGNCADYPVQFPKPFDAGTTPTVVVGFVSGSTAARFGVCNCAVLDGSVTNEGFTIRFYNGDVSSRIPGFSYIAFGTVTE